MANRPVFSSSLSTLLTMIGVAVGLGNVWRFPYMMGKYGGSAFLLVYLFFTLAFAIPALIAEISLGRATRSGPIGAFIKTLGPKGGRIIGYLLMITILVASSYYVVVIANVLFSAFYAIAFGFQPSNIGAFEQQLGNRSIQYIIVLITLIGTLVVLHLGLKRGIESVSKVFVPFFLVTIIYLIINALSLDGARQHFLHFLKPDFAALKITNVFAALGQAFYSLSLGGTFMLMYGSYLKKEESIPRLALFTSIGDVGAALLTGLFVVPTVLVFGLDLTSGPSLIFSTLPQLFSVMPAGRIIGSLFLVALSMVAILSLIGALEVAVGGLKEILNPSWTRLRLIIIVGLIEIFLAIPSTFHPEIIGILDLLFGSGMQLLGSGLALLALSWGLGKIPGLKAIFSSGNQSWKQAYFVWIKWVVPGVLLMVLIGYIYSSIF